MFRTVIILVACIEFGQGRNTMVPLKVQAAICFSTMIFAGVVGQPGVAWSQQPQAAPSTVFSSAVADPTPSIARADLLACSQLQKAKSLDGRNMAPQDLAGALQGTWVRELTWYGIAVDNESALYFQFSGTDFTAMMYDQSNMALGPMRQRLQTIRTSPELMAKTATLTFIDCDYYIVDKYYKISDQNVIDPASFRSSGFQIEALNLPKDVRDVAGEPGSGLRNVWNTLQRGGFFDQDFKSRAKVALLAGGQPLNEVTSPSVGGAIWQGSLKSANIANLQGVSLSMSGEYAGAHVGTGQGQRIRFTGSEVAQFTKEGDSFVSTVRPTGATEAIAGQINAGWLTDCGKFFGLPEPIIWERVVLKLGQ
jgi:hypothetical protein